MLIRLDLHATTQSDPVTLPAAVELAPLPSIGYTTWILTDPKDRFDDDD